MKSNYMLALKIIEMYANSVYSRRVSGVLYFHMHITYSTLVHVCLFIIPMHLPTTNIYFFSMENIMVCNRYTINIHYHHHYHYTNNTLRYSTTHRMFLYTIRWIFHYNNMHMSHHRDIVCLSSELYIIFNNFEG